jgi:hypothetical protein
VKDSSLVVASVGVSYRSSFMGSRREQMLVSAKGQLEVVGGLARCQMMGLSFFSVGKNKG